MATQVHLSEISPMLASVKAAGGDLRAVLAQHVSDGAADISDLPDDIALSDYFRIERDIARQSDDLTAQMSTRRLTYTTGKFVVSHLQPSRTLCEAAQGLSEYFNMMHGGAFNAVRLSSATVTMAIDDRDFPYTLGDDAAARYFMGESVLIKAHCLLNSLTNGRADEALRRVGIARPERQENAIHLGFWSVPITYRRPIYELVYDIDLALAPLEAPRAMAMSSPGLYARIIEQLERQAAEEQPADFLNRVVDLVKDGVTRQAEVAKALSISVATLRRRLAQEEISFRDIVLEDRHQAARRFLSDGQTVNLVSDRLGYSDIRAFNRAFKKRFGITPAAFRNETLAGSAEDLAQSA